ncbi:MAG: hypothetical protein PUF72_04905 [Clostridiales bacterium]|nr:hypothetical protein [Clostridiales bacterium]
MNKKIIAGVSALALSLSAFSGMVSAAEYGDFTLGNAIGKKTPNATTKAQYFVISSEAMKDQYSLSGEIYFSIPAGTCSGGVKSASVGLSYYDADNDETVYPNQMVGFIADGASGDIVAGDGYDTLKFSWYGSAPYSNADGVLAEIGIKPIDAAKDLEISIAGGVVGTCTFDMMTKENHDITDLAKSTTYIVPAGTCTVKVKEAGGGDTNVIPDPVADDNNATQINGSNEAGKFTFKGDTDNDYAVGFGKAFKVADLEGKSKIRWEITNNAGSWYNEVAIPELPASFEDANVRVGIVIQSGVEADLDTITSATAVLQ